MQPVMTRGKSGRFYLGTFAQGLKPAPRQTAEQHAVAHPEETIEHLLNRAALLRAKGEEEQAEELEAKAERLVDDMS